MGVFPIYDEQSRPSVGDYISRSQYPKETHFKTPARGDQIPRSNIPDILAYSGEYS